MEAKGRIDSLIDTGFLLAIFDASDNKHLSCLKALSDEEKTALPDVVIPELAYLIMRELGYFGLIDLLQLVISGGLHIVRTQEEDLVRTQELLQQYEDSKIDFVDCVIVAQAERLGIQRILTVDRRDFSLIRPNHVKYFEIKP